MATTIIHTSASLDESLNKLFSSSVVANSYSISISCESESDVSVVSLAQSVKNVLKAISSLNSQIALYQSLYLVDCTHSQLHILNFLQLCSNPIPLRKNYIEINGIENDIMVRK